jgi:hypothetical protein
MSDFNSILQVHVKTDKLNNDLINNANEKLEKLSEIDDFTYITIETLEVEYSFEAHHDEKYTCSILARGNHKFEFKIDCTDHDFLKAVSDAVNTTLKAIQKENNKRGDH